VNRLIVLVASALLSINSPAQKIPTHKASTEKTTPVIGRVLADVGSVAFGAGIGPKYTTFIFGVEQGGGVVVPVKVSYAFFKDQGPPPDSFFDHSRLYELQAVRQPKCDESVSTLAQIKNVDESGKPLPPTDAFRWLDGAPKDVLKPDLVLPCYILRAGKYKVLSQGHSAVNPDIKTRRPRNLHLTIPAGGDRKAAFNK
jgi:hypothetical protein